MGVSRLEPTNVAEVLTVRQVYILGIHTVGNLEGTGIVHLMCALEGVDVVLTLNEVHGVDGVDVLLAFDVGNDSYYLYAYCIVETLLVEYYGELHIVTADYLHIGYVGS